jgi:hypothetical protein
MAAAESCQIKFFSMKNSYSCNNSIRNSEKFRE